MVPNFTQMDKLTTPKSGPKNQEDLNSNFQIGDIDSRNFQNSYSSISIKLDI